VSIWGAAAEADWKVVEALYRQVTAVTGRKTMRKEVKIGIGIAILVAGSLAIYIAFSGGSDDEQDQTASLETDPPTDPPAETPPPTAAPPESPWGPDPTTPVAVLPGSGSSLAARTSDTDWPSDNPPTGISIDETHAGPGTTPTTPVAPGSSVSPSADDTVVIRPSFSAGGSPMIRPRPTGTGTGITGTGTTGTGALPSSLYGPRPTATTGTIYTVRAGDNGLSTIAQRMYGNAKYHGLIAGANPSVNTYALQPGQKLKIPPLPESARAAATGGTAVVGTSRALLDGSTEYIVKDGDMLWTLAAKFYGDGKHHERIAKANPGIDPNNLKVGQKLIIPKRTPTPYSFTIPTTTTVIAGPGETIHTVASGDRLWEIAEAAYGDGRLYAAIVKANPGINPDALKIGQKLRIPAKAVATAGRATPATGRPAWFRPVSPIAPVTPVSTAHRGSDTGTGLAPDGRPRFD